MSKDKNNKGTRRDRLRQLRAGLELHVVPNYKTITVNTVVYQVSDIMADIDADIAKSDAAEKGHAAWLQLVEEERASHAALDPIVSGVQQFVRLNFGNTEAQQGVLADFGMTPHKKRGAKPKKKETVAQPQASTEPTPAAKPAEGATTTPAKQ